MCKLLTTVILTLCLASVNGVPKQKLQNDYDFDTTSGWWDWWTTTPAWWWTTAAPETSTEGTTKATPIPCLFDCSHEIDGDYPDPTNNCTAHYYVCANGYCYNYYCPGLLVYDYLNDECVYTKDWPGCPQTQLRH